MDYNAFISELSRSPTHASLSPDDLESLGKKASSMYLCEGTPLSEAVVKVASDHRGISSEQVKRVVEFANTSTFHSLFDKQASDKNIEFDIADPNEVLRTINDGAKAPIVKVAAEEYSRPPPRTSHRDIEADLAMAGVFGIELRKTASMEKAAGVPEPEPETTLRDVLDEVTGMRKEAFLGRVPLTSTTMGLGGGALGAGTGALVAPEGRRMEGALIGGGMGALGGAGAGQVGKAVGGIGSLVRSGKRAISSEDPVVRSKIMDLAAKFERAGHDPQYAKQMAAEFTKKFPAGGQGPVMEQVLHPFGRMVEEAGAVGAADRARRAMQLGGIAGMGVGGVGTGAAVGGLSHIGKPKGSLKSKKEPKKESEKEKGAMGPMPNMPAPAQPMQGGAGGMQQAPQPMKPPLTPKMQAAVVLLDKKEQGVKAQKKVLESQSNLVPAPSPPGPGQGSGTPPPMAGMGMGGMTPKPEAPPTVLSMGKMGSAEFFAKVAQGMGKEALSAKLLERASHQAGRQAQVASQIRGMPFPGATMVGTPSIPGSPAAVRERVGGWLQYVTKKRQQAGKMGRAAKEKAKR